MARPVPLASFLVLLGYVVASAALLLVNKYVMATFPHPTVLTSAQYAVSATFAASTLLSAGTPFTRLLNVRTTVQFLPAAALFYTAVLSSKYILQLSSVETAVVFRSLTPLVTLALERATGRPPPSAATLTSLLVISGGAIGYARLESSGIPLKAFSWGVLYVIAMAVETVVVKRAISSLRLSTWSLVLYNNALALGVSPLGTYLSTGHVLDSSGWATLVSSPSARYKVALACVVGVCISFFGFRAKVLLGPTDSMVLGVANKLLTILGNAALGGSDVSAAGLACVTLSIGGSVAYQAARQKDGGGGGGGAEEKKKRASAARVNEAKDEAGAVAEAEAGATPYRTRQHTRASASSPTAAAACTPLAAAAGSPAGTRARRTRARE